MKKIIFSLLLLLVSGNARLHADVFAVENKSDVLYGQGVHAFFDGDYKGAIRLLKQVEQSGSEDPRPYYFLAIANHRIGNDGAADELFRKAAKLEWEGQAVRDYNVSDALRRIQGSERLFIEMFRKQAKIDWQKSEKQRQEVRYERNVADEKDVLATIARSFVGAAPFGARSVDPFRNGDEDDQKLIPADDSKPRPVLKAAKKEDGDGEEEPGEARTKPSKPAVKDSDEESDEAGETPKKEVKADDSDPFGDSDDMTEEKKADTKKEESEDEESDPFATSDTKKEEKKEQETKKDAEDEEEDPFK